MKGLTVVYTVSLTALVSLVITGCSSDVERAQSDPPAYRSTSSNAVVTRADNDQEPTFLHFASPEESVNSRSETYVF